MLERRARGAANIHFVTYGALLENAAAEFTKMLGFLGLEAHSAAVEAAVERSSFASLRAREEAHPRADRGFFFRKGREGSGAEELEPSVMDEIDLSSGALYRGIQKAAGHGSKSSR
jgi:hypothetical protein